MNRLVLPWLFASLLLQPACQGRGARSSSQAAHAPVRLQLNWFHDPTFSGEYRVAEQLGAQVVLLEGGVNVSPIQRLKSGLADIAVIGIDVALQAIEADLTASGTTSLRIVFADFQRNPVGWVVHPRVAARLGLVQAAAMGGRERNHWLFARFRDGSIRPGDKRGTETTAVWARWRQVHGLQGVAVTPVGFDPTVVLDAPRLAYPVYLNEEPFKLSERIGEPILTFDPADDGVTLYGNVIVTTAEVLAVRRDDISAFLGALATAWGWVRLHPDSAATIVRPFYHDVSDSVLVAEVRRTSDFVFFGTNRAGPINIQAGGRLQQTIEALASAGSIGTRITLSAVSPLVVAIAGSSP